MAYVESLDKDRGHDNDHERYIPRWLLSTTTAKMRRSLMVISVGLMAMMYEAMADGGYGSRRGGGAHSGGGGGHSLNRGGGGHSLSGGGGGHIGGGFSGGNGGIRGGADAVAGGFRGNGGAAFNGGHGFGGNGGAVVSGGSGFGGAHGVGGSVGGGAGGGFGGVNVGAGGYSTGNGGFGGGNGGFGAASSGVGGGNGGFGGGNSGFVAGNGGFGGGNGGIVGSSLTLNTDLIDNFNNAKFQSKLYKVYNKFLNLNTPTVMQSLADYGLCPSILSKKCIAEKVVEQFMCYGNLAKRLFTNRNISRKTNIMVYHDIDFLARSYLKDHADAL
ncbi:uncharacterized protein LOC134770176 [Penaeus indicus]|uniref:uncharacterized protein LOC134770176 n=1 Tax=Penaeus indicus TaxID=29960 RepID=UPI00300D7291